MRVKNLISRFMCLTLVDLNPTTTEASGLFGTACESETDAGRRASDSELRLEASP